MLAQSYQNLQAIITIDRTDWNITDRKETVTKLGKSKTSKFYSKGLVSIMLPIYLEIGQENLIAAHKKDPKNGIRNLIRKYMLKRNRSKKKACDNKNK